MNWAGRGGSPLVHVPEDPAVHRLEAVAHVGQRTRHDDRHGVVEEGPLHLVFDLDGLDQPEVGDGRIGAVIELVDAVVAGGMSSSAGVCRPRCRCVGGAGACRLSDVEEAHVLGVGLDEVLAGSRRRRP
jgi:hypothetical protein